MQKPAFDPEADRRRARFAHGVRETVVEDARRIVIVGASGWIGRTAIVLLRDALGPDEFADRVRCFGSRASEIEIDGGAPVPVRPLHELLAEPSQPTILLHLAFLTMDKVGTMAVDDYVRRNHALSQTVLNALDAVGVDRLFFASSGAASFADQADAAMELRLYGGLKRDQEGLFCRWAMADPDRRRAVVARIFSVSGPWINKHNVYALANFILDALSGRRVEVRSTKRVWRSYVAVRELVSLVFAALLAKGGPPVIEFETAGHPYELEQVGLHVTDALGGTLYRHPITDQAENRYLGDHRKYAGLLDRYGISHLGLSDQIIETAAYLERQRGGEPTSHG